MVISILAALGQEAELTFHVHGGLNHGLTADEIQEVMTHLCLYIGFPRAVEGMRAAMAVLAKVKAAPPAAGDPSDALVAARPESRTPAAVPLTRCL